MLFTTAPLQLEDDDLREIVLESPAGQRRRIDVEVGFTVFEVKRDLRQGNVRADAVEQLAGYVSSRTGVLTDGAERCAPSGAWKTAVLGVVSAGLPHRECLPFRSSGVGLGTMRG